MRRTIEALLLDFKMPSHSELGSASQTSCSTRILDSCCFEQLNSPSDSASDPSFRMARQASF